jgi:hypothetical protein
MCTRRVSRVKSPFGGLGIAFYRSRHRRQNVLQRLARTIRYRLEKIRAAFNSTFGVFDHGQIQPGMLILTVDYAAPCECSTKRASSHNSDFVSIVLPLGAASVQQRHAEQLFAQCLLAPSDARAPDPSTQVGACNE